MKPIILTLVSLSLANHAMADEPRTKVVVNGLMSPVYFNDGDTFRVLSGSLSGTKARLEGFNTLESFGPVHSWGRWSTRELYVNAKTATLHARRGIWRCSWDKRVDGYGRGLFKCPELAIHQIRAGLAHAMTVTADPAAPNLMDAQLEAQLNKRGIWAQGTPKWVLTSLHSVDERPDKPKAYNRLVSTVDGHSEKWVHTRRYKECEEVCVHSVSMTDEAHDAAVRALMSHEKVASHLNDQARDPGEVKLLLEVFGMTGSVAAWVPKEQRADYLEVLESLQISGDLQFERGPIESCMVYVDFKRRFGGDKAKCLK